MMKHVFDILHLKDDYFSSADILK